MKFVHPGGLLSKWIENVLSGSYLLRPPLSLVITDGGNGSVVFDKGRKKSDNEDP